MIFEKTLVGERLLMARVHDEEKGASIRVTDETAASGKHSLKFTDTPEMEHDYNPHMFYNLDLKSGKFKFSCDIKNSEDAPADFKIEMRDWRRGLWHAGPTFSITHDGELSASGQSIVTVPFGSWFHVEITFELGEESPNTYELKLTLPGEKPETFKNIPYGNEDFDVLTWLGISSTSDEKTVFYVDNIKLEPLRDG